MTTQTPEEARSQIVNMVRDFVRRDVLPIADEHDQKDIVPLDLIEKMKGMGLFGITVPEEWGGMGLDYTTFAMIFEEISKGWMSVGGIIGTHHIMTYVISNFGTEEQKSTFLPAMARGQMRGGLALTEPDAGSDVQSISLAATKDGEEYVLNGTKMFITNGRYGDTFAVLARTDPNASPKHRGLSCFIAQKGPGFEVGRDLDKLGYRGLDTCELIFKDYRVAADQAGWWGRGPRFPAGDERLGDGAHKRGGPLSGCGYGGIRGLHQVRSTAGDLRQTHQPAPSHPTQAGGYGYQDRGCAPAHLPSGRKEGPW